jgi:hypothetical protein
VAAELEALGLEVAAGSEGLLDSCSDDRSTRQAVVAAEALAAVELRMRSGEPNMLRICVVDVVTGKATARHWPESGLTVDQVALMVVEILHASLLELKVRHGTRGELDAPSIIRDRLLPQPRVVLGTRAGAGVWSAPGEVGAGAGGVFGLWLPLGGPLGIDADLLLGFTPGGVTEEHGAARVFPGVLRGHAVWALPEFGPLDFHLGLGGGVFAAQVMGRADAPYRATEGVGSTWVASGLLGAAFHIAEPWRLRLDGHVAWTARPLEVDILGEVAGRLGQPFLDATLSLEWLALSE